MSISHSSGCGEICFLAIGHDDEKTHACVTFYHRTLTTVKVSMSGRTVLSTTVLQVQAFCCSWWQCLIMCSTKQELWVM